jgi:hypothetical protein
VELAIQPAGGTVVAGYRRTSRTEAEVATTLHTWQRGSGFCPHLSPHFSASLVHDDHEPTRLYDKLALRGYDARAEERGPGDYFIHVAQAWVFEP